MAGAHMNKSVLATVGVLAIRETAAGQIVAAVTGRWQWPPVLSYRLQSVKGC